MSKRGSFYTAKGVPMESAALSSSRNRAWHYVSDKVVSKTKVFMDKTVTERNSHPTPVPVAVDCPNPPEVSLTETLELPAGPSAVA